MHLFALISQQSELETCWAANNQGLLGAQFPPQNIHLNTECGLLSSRKLRPKAFNAFFTIYLASLANGMCKEHKWFCTPSHKDSSDRLQSI